MEELLDTKAAARLTGLAPQTLASMRCTGRGAKFHRLGRRVLYSRAQLEAWIAENTHASTSDTGRDAQGGTKTVRSA